MRKSLAVICLLFPVNLFAEESLNTNISGIRTGWNGDFFAIVSADPVKNPASCPSADGYLSENSQPGYKTYYAAALTAYSINSKVTIIIDSTKCSLGRPKLIGINLFR